MLWFLMYCIWSGLFFEFGERALSLNWFWDGIFALLASGALTYSMNRVARSRLVQARLRKAIKAGKKTEDLQAIFEDAFGTVPSVNIIDDAADVGWFAVVPGSILAFVRFPMDSVAWRILSALVVAIPCAYLIGKVVRKLAAQRLMFEGAKKIIIDHDTSTWDKMDRVWIDREREMKEGA